MAIQVIKLVTGEDIVGDVTDKEDVLEVTSPIAVFIRADKDKPSSFKLGIVPWAPYAEGDMVPIYKNQVLSVFEPDEVLKAQYENQGGWQARASTPEVLNEATQ